jgi:putative nucleotidyltransferase with HDIG domain
MYVNVLVGSLVIRATLGAGLSRESAWFVVVVVVAIGIAAVINFLLAATWVRAQLRGSFLPELPWITAPNFLIGAVVALYIHVGPTSLLLSLPLVGGFWVLLSELLNSMRRRDELEKRTLELAALQVGVLETMVRTLSLRDRFTARHSAAVARYAHAIAEAAGCSEDELRTVHAAGLLHDIGKFAFPDRILLADGGLTDADFELVREHPVQGADLVRRVQGLEEIAAIIAAHHERVDGNGYPYALRGEEIPALARMISTADVYDVMTGRDSYRQPVSRSDAIAELRRVAGSQLDAPLVELFVGVLQSRRIEFTHSEDADFEAELALEQHIHELARPRVEA